jgi:hypothetical protein
MAGGGVGEAMLISAAMGGGTAAITGGDPLKGALLGAATGGIGHGIAGATAAGGAGATGATAATSTGVDAATNLATTGATDAATNLATTGADVATTGAGNSLAGTIQTPGDITAASKAAEATRAGFPDLGVSDLSAPFEYQAVSPQNAASNSMFPRIAEMSKSGYFYPGLGAASGLIGAGPETNMPSEDEYSGSLGRFNYDPDRYRPYRAASGGLMDTEPARRMAAGGLGSYSDGGQMLKGPGDGMSDDIPASIGDEQPARLADGEFVVPADVVSGIGNGSTDAGAEALYAMLDRVRKARTGRTEQAPEIDAQRMMPA